MRDTGSVTGNRRWTPHQRWAWPLSVVLVILSMACSSRSTSPTVPTLPKPSTPAPAPPSTPTADAPTPSSTPTASQPEAQKPTLEAGSRTGKSAEGEGKERGDGTSGAERRGSIDAEAPGDTPAAPAPSTGPLTTEERKEALDSDLDASLSEFDRMLLREQEILAEEQAAQAAAEGGGPSGSSGGALGGLLAEEGATETSDASPGSSAAGGTGGSPDTPPGEASEAGAPVGGKEDAVSTNGRVPPDVGDGSDDDIVARQLREAAMKEDDPELREKLWDEYRAYKKGTTRSDN